MKKTNQHVVIFVTAPNMKVGRMLAKAALESHLCACVNLVPKLESHYWWEGKLETASEVLLIIKTRRGCLSSLEELILSRHPYENPEFIVSPLAFGSHNYLEWIDRMTKTVKPSKP